MPCREIKCDMLAIEWTYCRRSDLIMLRTRDVIAAAEVLTLAIGPRADIPAEAIQRAKDATALVRA